MPYPTKAELAEIVMRTSGNRESSASPVAGADELVRMREIAASVPIAQNVLDHALQIVVGTHPTGPAATDVARSYCRYGSSPRGAQSLVAVARVYALLDARFNVAKEDIRKAAPASFRHRLLLNYEADAEGITADEVIQQVIQAVDAADRDPIQV